MTVVTVTREFYVKGFMIRATFAIAALQLVFAASLFASASSLGVGPVIPAVFALGGLLTGYLGHWTSRTPLATVREAGLLFRPALLAQPIEVAWDDVRAFARVPPGWLVLLGPEGGETRIAITGLSDVDQEALVALLHDRLTEVSYAES